MRYSGASPDGYQIQAAGSATMVERHGSDRQWGRR
jgi:hypothetical protein